MRDAANWSTLGDMASIVSGGTPKKSNSSYWSGDIPWVSAKDMKSVRLRDAEDHITADALEAGSRLAPAQATLLLTRGMTLLSDVPICLLERDMAFNQDVKAIVAKGGVDPRFLNFALRAAKPALLRMVELAGHGTGRLSTDQLRALRLPRPQLPRQRAIAEMLDALDGKIDLNRHMNETLEATARAIYKSWFVDFDPVRAKSDGGAPALPSEHADMFPDRFVDTVDGDIPRGWTRVAIREFSLLNPQTWRKDARPAIISYLDLSNTKWGRIDSISRYARDEAPSRAQRVLGRGDTVVGTVRPGNGSYALIAEDGLTGSTGFAVLRPTRKHYEEFVYLAATDAENIEALAHLADGGAYPAVRPEVVAARPVINPGERILEIFSQVTGPLLAQMSSNERDSRTLAKLRDELMPRLFSGEARPRE